MNDPAKRGLMIAGAVIVVLLAVFMIVKMASQPHETIDTTTRPPASPAGGAPGKL